MFDYPPLDFSPWQAVSLQNKTSFLSGISKSPGVFVVRIPRTEKILHVGAGNNKNGLKQRLRQIFSPGRTQDSNNRILKELQIHHDLDFSFAYTSDPVLHRDALKIKLLK